MKRLLLATCLLLLFTAACTGGGGIVVEDAKANLTLPSTTGAVYMTITNESDEDDALVRADVPGCGSVELHEMKMDGDVMVMQQVPGGEIPIPAGETVELMQGGLHVMCIDKTGTFELGDTVGVTLEFAKAGRVQVDADIVAPGK
jgi:hypothetical protein